MPNFKVVVEVYEAETSLGGSNLVLGPWFKDEIVELSEELAEWIERDGPGTLKPYTKPVTEDPRKRPVPRVPGMKPRPRF